MIGWIGRDRNDLATGQPGLWPITHPRWLWHQHIPIQHLEQRVDQRLAARSNHHLLRATTDAPRALDVTRDSLAQFQHARHRCVARALQRPRQRLAQSRMQGKHRLTKAQVQRLFPFRAPPGHRLIQRQRRRGSQTAQSPRKHQRLLGRELPVCGGRRPGNMLVHMFSPPLTVV